MYEVLAVTITNVSYVKCLIFRVGTASPSVKYSVFYAVVLLFLLKGASEVQGFQRDLATGTVNFNLVLTC